MKQYREEKCDSTNCTTHTHGQIYICINLQSYTVRSNSLQNGVEEHIMCSQYAYCPVKWCWLVHICVNVKLSIEGVIEARLYILDQNTHTRHILWMLASPWDDSHHSKLCHFSFYLTANTVLLLSALLLHCQSCTCRREIQDKDLQKSCLRHIHWS